MAFGSELIDQIDNWKGYERAIQQVTDKVSVLGRALKGLQASLNDRNIADGKALNTARKLAEVQERYNNALRAQKDLIREAKGVNVSELEAAKGRNSIKTRQAAEQFRAKQSSEELRVQQALERLEQRSVSSLDEVLNIEVRRNQVLDQQLRKKQELARLDNQNINKNVSQFQGPALSKSGQLALPSSEMLNAATRNIQRIETSYQKATNEFNEGIQRGIRLQEKQVQEAQRLERIYGKINQVAGAPGTQPINTTAVQGPGNAAGQQAFEQRKKQEQAIFNERARLAKLAADLERSLVKGTNSLRVKQDAARYRLEQRRLKKLAAQEKEAAKARSQRAESIALGVGFPALFGGGVGSIGGSAAGSFVGSGFGGQILGGAVGQAIDTYIQGLTDLAKSMESTQGIIQGLETAGYDVSASIENVIKSYQEAGLESEAYKLALEEINRVLGPDGASKLSDYRIETENLSREFQNAKAAIDSELLPALTGTIRLILDLKGAFDTLAESPLFRFISGANNLAAQALPGIGDAQRAFSTAQELGAVSGDVVMPESQRLAQEEAVLQKLQEQSTEFENQQQKIWEAEDAARAKNELLEAEIEVVKAGTDLLDDNVYLKRQEAIEQAYINELIAAGTNLEAQRTAQLGKTLALLKLAAARDVAVARAAKAGGGGGSAPKSKALQIQQQLIREEIKRNEIGVKYLQIVKGEEAALIAKQQLLSDRLDKETQIIDLQRKQALERNKVAGDVGLINQLYDSRLNTLTQQLQLQQQQNAERLRAIALEKELTGMRGDNEVAGIGRDLTRQIEDAQFRTENPFGGMQAEQMQLQIDQARRYEDAIRPINEALAEQQAIVAANVNADSVAQAEREIELLERKKTAYEQLLPALNAAEQQELKMQQTLQALQPITDGLAAGITDFFTSVIDGSKSAEEAFVDMLKGMAAALIQQGAQMIAQYMAIALAKAIAGMGSSPSGGGVPTPLTSGMNFFGGGRAAGGPVNADTPYIVGEQGAELFIPGKSGTVMNNDDFADAAAAMSGSAQAFSESGEAMMMASATRSSNSAIKAEQAAAAKADEYFQSGKSTVKFDTFRVGQMDVVTREDAMKIGMQAAKQAEANVYKGLRNKPALRSRNGIKS